MIFLIENLQKLFQNVLADQVTKKKTTENNNYCISFHASNKSNNNCFILQTKNSKTQYKSAVVINQENDTFLSFSFPAHPTEVNIQFHVCQRSKLGIQKLTTTSNAGAVNFSFKQLIVILRRKNCFSVRRNCSAFSNASEIIVDGK